MCDCNSVTLDVRLIDEGMLRRELLTFQQQKPSLYQGFAVLCMLNVCISNAGQEGGEQQPGLRQLMTSPQTDQQRRQIYFALAHPILQSIFDSLRTYFQSIYRVSAPQPQEEQARIDLAHMHPSILHFALECVQNALSPCHVDACGFLMPPCPWKPDQTPMYLIDKVSQSCSRCPMTIQCSLISCGRTYSSTKSSWKKWTYSSL